jgi:hypothetical protein
VTSKATRPAPLCEAPALCRGLRPYHARRERGGTWEISGPAGQPQALPVRGGKARSRSRRMKRKAESSSLSLALMIFCRSMRASPTNSTGIRPVAKSGAEGPPEFPPGGDFERPLMRETRDDGIARDGRDRPYAEPAAARQRSANLAFASASASSFSRGGERPRQPSVRARTAPAPSPRPRLQAARLRAGGRRAPRPGRSARHPDSERVGAWPRLRRAIAIAPRGRAAAVRGRSKAA